MKCLGSRSKPVIVAADGTGLCRACQHYRSINQDGTVRIHQWRNTKRTSMWEGYSGQ